VSAMTFEPLGDLTDIINCTYFDFDRLRGMSTVKGRKWPFPILKPTRP
jgi:hypothetical protein